MIIPYNKTSKDFIRLHKQLSQAESISGFEIVSPPGFGIDVFLKQIFNASNTEYQFKRVLLYVREDGDMGQEVRNKVGALFDHREDTSKPQKVWVEIREFDRRKAVAEASDQCLRALDDIMIQLESHLVHKNDRLVILLCTRRRHLGAFPMRQLDQATLSRVERKISGSFFVKLLSQEDCEQILLANITPPKFPPERINYLTKLTGGSPNLMKTVISIIEDSPSQSIDSHIQTMQSIGARLFKDIWDNVDEHERLMLIAYALIRASQQDNSEVLSEPWRTVSDLGVSNLVKFEGYRQEMLDLGILRVDHNGIPCNFSPLFDAWLINNAMASSVENLISVEDILVKAVSDRPSYLQTVEAALPNLFEKLVDKAGNKAINALVNQAPTLITNLILGA